MTYEALARFAQQGGAIYFAIVFICAVIYALWPKNKEKFDRMAHLPLGDANEDAPITSEHPGLEK